MGSTLGDIELEPIEAQPPVKDLVVCARKVMKKYGPGRKSKTVLRGLNMNVEKGTIYGLLGSSGCGKTTLLSCIVGTRKIDGGSIWVLGGTPGGRGSGVPGPNVGYMPQELSLMERFTTKENLQYFGLLCGRDIQFVDRRAEELTELLELPKEATWARNLSGGQKRRLSLAIAMLHNPQLIVLDEPTVGVDPLLRVSIWQHLIDITTKQRLTVIVTTHYIEEARHSNTVGLMRNGLLLAEDNPEKLLLKFNSSCLEEVFLKVAQKEVDYVTLDESETTKTDTQNVVDLDLILKQQEKNVKVSAWKRLQIILWKLLIDTYRNPSGYFFIFILPLLQIALFCVTVGRNPTELRLGVVNDELTGNQTCENYTWESSEKCTFETLSCQYLYLLGSGKARFKQETIKTLEEAKMKAKRGEIWGLLYFGHNYTANVLRLLEEGQAIPEELLNSSMIEIFLDMSNEAVSHFIQHQIYSTFSDLMDLVANRCGWDPRTLRSPYKFNPELYGVEDPSYIHFCIPGSLGVIGFVLSAVSTAGYVFTDRDGGITDRSKVCGMQNGEAYSAYILINTIIIAIQSGLTLLLLFSVFQLPHNGSWILTYLLLYLQGISGATFGLLVAVTVEDVVTFTHITIGYNFSSIFISGNTWPIEGMHWTLQYISPFIHFTSVIQAFRSIIFRGWGISSVPVYSGFATAGGWISMHIILLSIVSTYKSWSA